jgi:hypothetical protein
VLLAVGLVVREARAYAHGLRGYRLDAKSIRYVDLDARIGPYVWSALADPVRLRLDVSVFDARAEEVVRDAVARNPMVECVRSVEVRYPREALVRIILRRPAAWFEARRPGGVVDWILVSRDGHRLDEAVYAGYVSRLRIPLPKVVGVRARAPRWPGQRWADGEEQVAEALAATRVAAELYRELSGRVRVETIDVSAFPAPPERRRLGEVRLLLDDGTRVEWGRTERALAGVASEDPYAVKRWRLEAELGRLPNGKGRIDVRYRLPQEGREANGPR